jgi:hypothetical protein
MARLEMGEHISEPVQDPQHCNLLQLLIYKCGIEDRTFASTPTATGYYLQHRNSREAQIFWCMPNYSPNSPHI